MSEQHHDTDGDLDQTVDDQTVDAHLDATAEQLAPLADAVEGNEEDLATLLDRLDDVNALLDVAALGTDAMDDEMVTKVARTGSNLGEVADAAAEPETVRGLESMLNAVGDATGDLEEPPEKVGLLGFLRAMRDPEVQAGMGFLVTVSKHLGADLTRRSELRQEQGSDR